MADATAAYQEESDLLANFLSERCVMGDGYRVQASTLYHTYTSWADVQGLQKSERLSSTMFGQKVTDRFSKTKSHGVNVYQGIAANNGDVSRQAALPNQAKSGEGSALENANAPAQRPAKSPSGEGLGEGFESESPKVPLYDPVPPRVGSNQVNASPPPPGKEYCKDCDAELSYYDAEGTGWCAKHGPGTPA